MSRYYRIQPTGLALAGHYSETSAEELADGVHVFGSVQQLLNADAGIEAYGDEVVEIEAERHWSNGDVEGVCVDPETATIARRWSLAEFRCAIESCPRDEYGLLPDELP